MAKDVTDTKTLEMHEVPKKRGRPKTGEAKSAAQRKREQRERDREILYGGNYAENLRKVSIEGLLRECREVIAHGKWDDLMNLITEEMTRRFNESAANRDSHPKD